MADLSKCLFGVRVHIAMAVQFALVFQPKYYAHIKEDGLHTWLMSLLNFTLDCVRYQIGLPELRIESVWLGSGRRGYYWVIPERFLPAHITPEDETILTRLLDVVGDEGGPRLFVPGNGPEPDHFRRWRNLPNFLKESTFEYFLWDLATEKYTLVSLMNSFTLEIGESNSITFDRKEAFEKYYSEPNLHEAANPDIFCDESPYYYGYIVNFLQVAQCVLVHDPAMQIEVEKKGFNVTSEAMLRLAIQDTRMKSKISDLCVQSVWIGNDQVAYCWALPKRFRPGYRTSREDSVLEGLKSILGIQEQPAIYFSNKIPEPEYLQDISERCDQSTSCGHESCEKGFGSGAFSITSPVTSDRLEILSICY